MYSQEILSAPCPCGKGKNFEGCCHLAISGEQPAPTAKKLMRSRYTAYVLGEVDYLLSTLAPEMHQADEQSLIEEQITNTQWQGLIIVSAKRGSRKDSDGEVTFEARFKAGDESGVMRETSNFRRGEQQQWLYVDGDVEVLMDQ